MATRVSVNGGPTGVGIPTTPPHPTPRPTTSDLGQGIESNSSFDSDHIPTFPTESRNKKRRKQSRPSRIPHSEDDLNPLNLSKASPTHFLHQFHQNLPETSSGGSGGSTHSTNNRELGSSLPPNRIFNPEAYCDLCNKEFCNKYFLKTHKANKHGVYTDLPPSNGSYPSNPQRPEEMSNDLSIKRVMNHFSGRQKEDSLEESLDVTCHFCGSEFGSETELRSHVGEKHGLLVPGFLAPFPPSSTPPSLFDLPKNSPSEPFDCSRCSRSFATRYLLRMHISYFHASNNNNNKDDERIKEECLSPEETTTSDSDELRRLQSMILDLNPTATTTTTTTTSGGDGSLPPWNPNQLPQPITNQNTTTACPLCGKEFYSNGFLTQHMEQSHGGQGSGGPIKEEETKPRVPTDPFLLPSSTGSTSTPSSIKADRRPSPSLSRSYCTICHKELCNKYFMRTHMLKMHGISIESSTGLGGVTCDICNKELCSKYFLKVHKQNTHGILEEGPSPPTNDSTDPQPANNQLPPPTTSEMTPLDLHSPSEPCPICSKRFKSLKWLKNHLLTDHGQEGKDTWKTSKKTGTKPSKARSRGSRSGKSVGSEDEPPPPDRLSLDPLNLFFGKMEGAEGGGGLYRCNYCPFTTPLLVYHYAHERTHAAIPTTTNTFQCPMCFQAVGSLEAFQQHLFSHGLLPPFLPQPPNNQPPPTETNFQATKPNNPKRLVFRCSACKLSFGQRADCLGHVKREHRRSGGRKRQKLFKCRKCPFRSGTYAKWRVHFKVHHDRPPKMFEVVGGGSGVVLQRFLLGVGEGEPFVPSLVYLPVRTKVSQSMEVSFNLTPRS